MNTIEFLSGNILENVTKIEFSWNKGDMEFEAKMEVSQASQGIVSPKYETIRASEIIKIY